VHSRLTLGQLPLSQKVWHKQLNFRLSSFPIVFIPPLQLRRRRARAPAEISSRTGDYAPREAPL
jgi:hypothetical protein